MKLLPLIVVVGSLAGGWLTSPAVRGAEPAAIGRVNLTLAQYNTANKEMQARDYRPASLSVYRLKGESFYTVMWQRAGQLAWKEGLDRSLKDYEADVKSMQDAEFRPISLQVLMVDGQPRYMLIWKKMDGEYYYFRDRLTADTFRKFSTDYAQRDFYPTSICAYEVRGQLMYAGIWEKTRPGSVQFELDLTEAALAQKSKTQQAKGFHPEFLSGYFSRGRPLWAAIWVQREGVEVRASPSLTEAEWLKQSAELEMAGYDLMSLQGMALAGKPRFAAVWRKVKELPEEPAANPKQ